MDVLAEIVRRALSVQKPPSAELVLATALVAFALVAVASLWRVTSMAATIAHEGGHAFAALVSGHRLRGIRLHRDRSGLTLVRSSGKGPAEVFGLSAGYLGPAVVGLVAALLLASGHALALLWLLVLALALMLLMVRNLYGLLVLVVAGLAMVAISWYLSGTVQSTIAYLITWVLLLAAPKSVLELMAIRRQRPTPDSDVDQLARVTRVPGSLWAGLFLVANLAGLAIGVAILVPQLVRAVAPGLH